MSLRSACFIDEALSVRKQKLPVLEVLSRDGFSGFVDDYQMKDERNFDVFLYIALTV
jgi:hypothetical protein